VLIPKIGDFIDFWNFNEKILTLIPKIKDFITSTKKKKNFDFFKNNTRLD
jgi:hypothetical protein